MLKEYQCPNLTCCADCRIDDFCHSEGCEILAEVGKEVAKLMDAFDRLKELELKPGKEAQK